MMGTSETWTPMVYQRARRFFRDHVGNRVTTSGADVLNLSVTVSAGPFDRFMTVVAVTTTTSELTYAKLK